MLGYKQVSGNSNVVFDKPIIALLIRDPDSPDFSPEISSILDEDSTFNNWMYIRKSQS